MSLNTSKQGELTAGRIILLTEENANPPDNTTEPTVILSPNAPTGLKTTGVLIMLEEPVSPGGDNTPATEPFDVTPWIRNPTTGFYGSGETLTGVLYGQAFVTYDFDAAELYFQIVAGEGDEGVVYLHVMEQ